ncbi:MAG: pyridoxine 5'-phosphate synthase [Verrucomicrobia bacterium]|jgi:pyridoxine 5-phosphate synthase|nr:pyridoxine 5'-phosphate synthase [Verrucomicrobiota bacterium]
MLKLGVNIDHVATLRQARGTDYPDMTAAARSCEAAGAEGITIHLREDRRHIQDADVYTLRERLQVPMNLEMANSPEIVGIALDVKPHEVCLVPEKREELTTEGGLDVAGQLDELRPTIESLAAEGVSVSLFIDPDPAQIEASASLGVPYVELHTGTFCDAEGSVAEAELNRLIEGARLASSAGIKVNAGHGINLDNIAGILHMPHLDTLNIGHSIVAHAVFVGLENAVRAMIAAMGAYRGGEA